MYKLFSPSSIKASLSDLLRVSGDVYANRIHVQEALDWLIYAQEVTRDGGVSAWYSFAKDWAPSFIETTGYISSTFLEASRYLKNKELGKRAIKMADFLLEMQLEDGSFRSIVPSVDPEVEPKVFDTGQDILGLCDIYQFNKNTKYLEAVKKASDFLCSIQEKDGSWVKFTFGSTQHTYHTRVAWALLRVFEITNIKKYKKHAIKNLEWALLKQRKNGWFQLANFPPPNPEEPYTHTISYVIEGLLYSGLILEENKYIKSAQLGADAILNEWKKNMFLSGTYNEKWESKDKYTCLTGDAQIACVWLRIFEITKDRKYFNAAAQMNRFLKSTQNTTTENLNIRGGIKGSIPIFGDLLPRKGYSRMAYVNWAAKFFIDALILESCIAEKNGLEI